MKKRVVHFGVPDRGNQLVPWCQHGYAAYQRLAFVAVNTIPSQVDCEHCKKAFAPLASQKPPRTRNRLDCPRCGHVSGATAGYPKLTLAERKALLDAGYEVDQNVHGDEIARKTDLPNRHFNTARFELHRVICRPTRLERI